MKKIILLLIILNLFLTSCSTVRESAGVNRKVIDEYSVIENPPLVIPPNFNLLPIEQIKSKDIEDADSELAKEILFGLDNDQNKVTTNNSLISEIVSETKGNNEDLNIRKHLMKILQVRKSTTDDETIFNSKEEFNNAINETNKKGSFVKNKGQLKEKKKKDFSFFNLNANKIF